MGCVVFWSKYLMKQCDSANKLNTKCNNTKLFDFVSTKLQWP